MANISGSFTFSGMFNTVATSPIDTRMLVNSLSDLVSEDSWNSKTHPVYKGMVVSVAESGEVYVLLDPTNTTSMDSWKKLGGDIEWIEWD